MTHAEHECAKATHRMSCQTPTLNRSTCPVRLVDVLHELTYYVVFPASIGGRVQVERAQVPVFSVGSDDDHLFNGPRPYQAVRDESDVHSLESIRSPIIGR